MKNALLLIISFFVFFIHSPAQQVPRNLVVIEIGTGTWCQYCPAAANGAEDLLDGGYPVAVIKYHSGDDYANVFSNARVNYYVITGFPTAFFDGLNPVVGGGSATQTMFPQYAARVNQRMTIQSPFSIGMQGTHACLTDFTANVTVNKVAANSSSDLRLHAVVTEKHIPKFWQGMPEVNQACRLMIPSQNGSAVSFASGNTQNFNLQFSLDPSWVFENLELVVFLQDHATKEIFQASKMMLTEFIPEHSYDAAVISIINLPKATCNGIFEPQVRIRNVGAEVLTAVDIVCQVNEGTPNTYSWTGALNYLEYETVTLPVIDFTVTENNQLLVFTENPNGNIDGCPSNDQMTRTIPAALHTPNTVKLIMRTDANPQETTWELMNSAGEVLFSGGPYTSSGQMVQQTFELEEEDCHIFAVYDSGGDGLLNPGFMMLYYGNNTVIYQGTSYGYGESIEFNTADPVGINENIQISKVHIIPNPVSQQASLLISLEHASDVRYQVYSITGQLVAEAQSGRLTAGQHSLSIDASGWTPGLYVYKVWIGNVVNYGKFSVR